MLENCLSGSFPARRPKSGDSRPVRIFLAKIGFLCKICRILNKYMTTKAVIQKDNYAVIETGGKQYRVSVGDIVSIEKIPGDFKEGDKVTFDNVVLVDDGKSCL